MRRYIVVVLLLAAGAAGAREEKRPWERYAQKEAEFLRAIAAKYVELGDEARKAKLYQFAREAYEEALKYQEHNRTARKLLGYVRRGRKWVLDPVESRKLPEKNTRPQNVSEDEFRRTVVKDFLEKKRKVGVYVGRKYAGLGRWCQKEGYPDQAKKAWEKALHFDPDNEIARKGLGYRKVDGKWLTEKQIRARKEAKEGKLVDDSPSRFEGPLGVKLTKMESAHFRVETVYGPKAAKNYIKNLETTYAYFLRDVGQPEDRDVFGGRKAFFLVLGSKEQWVRYVDLFHGGSKRQKEFTKKLRGSLSSPGLFGAQYEGEKGNESTTIDGLVHKAAHFLVYHYWNLRPAWLSEGFAYYYTVKVLNSTRTHCVALGTYEHQGGGMKKWGDSENWKELVKGEVLKNADPDLRMFFRVPISELQFQASVKAWSLITWLFDKHREKFLKWLEAVGHRGAKQEDAFREIFGWPLEQVDKEWREYVKVNT